MGEFRGEIRKIHINTIVRGEERKEKREYLAGYGRSKIALGKSSYVVNCSHTVYIPNVDKKLLRLRKTGT